MVVVFFGTPQFAVPTLRHLLTSTHQVSGVVTQPDRPRGRGQKVTDAPVKMLAVQSGLPLIQPDRLADPEVAATMTSWQPDIGVVVAYGRLIPDALLRIPRHGMINVHASLLPKYRGAAPIHRAIIDGAAETGITIMRVAKRLDSGNMLATATRPLGPDDTSDVVEQDLSELGARLLLRTLDSIEAGTAHEDPQDESLATYAGKISRSDGVIDWGLPAAAIHNRVRGLHPWPHAFSYLDGTRLLFLRTRVVPEPTTAPPGTVISVSRDRIEIATGDGRLAVEQVQPEGKRPMPVRDYLSGRPVAVGARFSTT